MALGCALALAGCATSRSNDPPVRTKTFLQGETDLNPDSTGRASPVVLRVFLLKSDAEFSAADFFALYERDKESLGSSLLSREEYVLKPGERRELWLPVPRDTAYIGVVSHPYFAVSGTGGTFEIANVPAGTYTIQTWHERFGSLTRPVRVTAGATAIRKCRSRRAGPRR